MTTTDTHAAIALARENGGIPEIKEPINASCRTVFRYQGLSEWHSIPQHAAEAFLRSKGIPIP